ncbi:MAG: M56 family metallopeptidase [Lachnospiraceae bacterium]|nr:M56 family metallopeptidase [Lachnospiraceae bacterium]
MLHFRMNMPFYLMAFYGSIMIIIVLIMRGLLKNRLPKFVFPALWCVVLVRLLVPFSLSSPLSMKVPAIFDKITYVAQTAEDTSIIVQDQSPLLLEGGSDTTVIAVSQDVYETSTAASQYTGNIATLWFQPRVLVLGVYLLGLAATIGILSLQKYRCTKRLKNRLLIEHNETINTMLREMDMGHIPVFTCDEIASPLVSGFLNPSIYLPTRMNFQDTVLLRHILAHETMHIKRHDNYAKAVMLLTLCLHWFNPLVWIMSKYLSADLENACDAALLKSYDAEERKVYAMSLLSMAVSRSRTTLLYSAFSRTEIEKRVKNILHYKKASALILAFSFLFLICGTTVFATGVQAPFSHDLSSYCASSNCRWGCYVDITRDIYLGENAQRRAENVIIDVLKSDNTNDPEIMEEQIKAALTETFGVEKGAFRVVFSLCLDDEEKYAEYADWDIFRDEDGIFSYHGEKVRVCTDELAGMHIDRDGTIDIAIHRDRYGFISGITAQHEGEEMFDEQTRSYGLNR